MGNEECLKPVASGSKEIMRSYVDSGPFIPPEPNYDVGEQAFIGYENPKKAKDIVLVASKGRWNKKKQQNEYVLKLRKDGTLFERGDWIEEGRLNARA